MKVTKEYLTQIIRESIEEIQNVSEQETSSAISVEEAVSATDTVIKFLSKAPKNFPSIFGKNLDDAPKLKSAFIKAHEILGFIQTEIKDSPLR